MTFDRKEQTALLRRLITSLENLISESTTTKDHNPRIQNVISALNKVHIPENDYAKILAFSFLLACEIPEILRHPKSSTLRKLTQECLVERSNELINQINHNSQSR